MFQDYKSDKSAAIHSICMLSMSLCGQIQLFDFDSSSNPGSPSSWWILHSYICFELFDKIEGIGSRLAILIMSSLQSPFIRMKNWYLKPAYKFRQANNHEHHFETAKSGSQFQSYLVWFPCSSWDSYKCFGLTRSYNS